MTTKTPAKNLDQYIVRFPDGMRDTLKAEAAKNNRSLNAEIVDRLEKSLAENIPFPPEVDARIRDTVQQEMLRWAKDNLGRG